MLRPHALIVAVVFLGASGIATADDSPTQTLSLSDTERQTIFAQRVVDANRASLAGRDKDAVELYKKALQALRHPVIAGRLGLLLVKLGQLDRAAEELHEAVTRGQGVSAAERQAIQAAYDKAKLATTWVNVDISHAGATVVYNDKESRNPDKLSAFWMFALPGEHTLRAKLEGYEDAVATFTANAGEEITVSLKLVPLASATPADELLRKRRPDKLRHSSSNVATDPDYNFKEDPFYEPPKPDNPQEKTWPRFSVSAGVVTVFGVASWMPAVGPVVGVGLRPKEWLSFGLEGRAAWLTTGLANQQISAMTAGGIVAVCGHLKWLFGCPLGHLGVIRTEGVESTFAEGPFNNFRPGVGGRLGVRFRPMEHLRIQATADALAFTRRTRIFVGNEPIADQPAAMIGTQIIGEWEL